MNGNPVKVCLGEETRDPAVAVEKRMNPRKTMVGGRGRNKLQRAMMPVRCTTIVNQYSKKEAESIDPASFLIHFKRFLVEPSLDSCQPNQTEAKKEHG